MFLMHVCTAVLACCASPSSLRLVRSFVLALNLVVVVVSVADVVQSKLTSPAPVRRRKERPQVLNLSNAELAGVLRPRPGRLDSPSNRYAGDWSGCKDLRPTCPEDEEEADYADVPSEEENKPGYTDDEMPERGNEVHTEVKEQKGGVTVGEGQELEDTVLTSYDRMPVAQEEHRAKEHTYQAFMKIQEISPVLSNRVNLRDLQESIDVLIGNLEQELNKNKLNVGY